MRINYFNHALTC